MVWFKDETQAVFVELLEKATDYYLLIYDDGTQPIFRSVTIFEDGGEYIMEVRVGNSFNGDSFIEWKKIKV